MTGASKILTVSYGTFSCTLEGFDDPFNTMKAIAEYFRDLAAEDRYFGAEPPTPDAAMLHRIAEREIQRRVEAKVQENGIVLRASDDSPPAVASDAAPAPKAEAAPAAPPATPRLVDATPQANETVAEKLSRLRAEVAGQAGGVAGGQTAAPAATVLSVALPAETAYSVPEFVAPDFGEDEDYDLPAGRSDFADAPAIETDLLADALPEDSADPASDLPEDVAQDDALTAADDIAPPVAGSEITADAAPATDAASDMPAPFAAAADPVAALHADGTDALLSSLLADLSSQPADPAPQEQAPQEQALAEAWPEEDTLAIDDDSADAAPVAQVIASVEDDAQDDAISVAQDDDATADPAPDATEASIFASDEDAAHPEPLAGSEAEAFSIFATDEAEDLLQDTAAYDDASAATDADLMAADETLAMTDPDPTPAPAADLRPDASEKLMRARARVIRIRRTEADADPAASAPQTDSQTAATAAILSPEAEADLAAELAALSLANDAADDEGKAPFPQTAETPASLAASAEAETARRAFGDAGADATISRLMAQADEHLEGPESKRRISAIAHLKAAVAATVAERRATGDKPKDAEPSQLSRYRDDLAKVVRNKLGGGSAAGEQRLAPLVLVSEQRIDRPRPVAAAPQAPAPVATPAPQSGATIMPRRIAGGTSLAFAQDEEEMEDFAEAIADSSDFREFADRLGAKTLGEMIEASAAYLACVEGRDHFTRPQLMGLVQAALPDGDLPREDGLRSFGTLLRSGRIEKVRRGQFAISDRSSYLAEGRRIAG